MFVKSCISFVDSSVAPAKMIQQSPPLFEKYKLKHFGIKISVRF
jgi:hypothetical protein